MSAGPIIKWAGGKAKLASEIRTRLPERFGRYYEPFCGGAAVFFALAPAQAVLGDANDGLMTAYRAIAEDPDDVLAQLEHHIASHSEEHYEQARAQWNDGLHAFDPAARAAALLYLNRAGYNGLWRENAAGRLNTPWGQRTRAQVRLDPDRLRAAAAALARATIRTGDYRFTLRDVAPGDAAYIDSPYDGTFTAYTAGGFGDADQRALAAEVRRLAAAGVHVVASNADTPFIRELYAGLRIEVVRAARNINSDAEGRGPVDEVLIVAGPEAATTDTRRPSNMSRKQQTEIPGTERPTIAAVEEAADEYRAIRDQRMELSKKEKTLQATLVATLKQYDLTSYVYEDSDGVERRVSIKATEKATVRKVKGDDEEDEDTVDNADGSGPH